MQLPTLVVTLAIFGVTVAKNHEVHEVCKSNACLAAVTGAAALGDPQLRSSHCASYLAITVTPPAATVTATITGTESLHHYKRTSVTVCPNEVPNYASACNTDGYASACSCFGFTATSTTTLAPTITTRTTYVQPTCAPTVTATVPSCSSSSDPTRYPSDGDGKCISQDQANFVVNSFINFLTNTNVSLAGPAAGFNATLAEEVLADDFTDTSDSINYMAGAPLGSVSMNSKDAFIDGQSNQPQVDSVKTLNLWRACHALTWRWQLTPYPNAPSDVIGMNYMIINDQGQLQTNYAEFDNAAWLFDIGQTGCVPAPQNAVNDSPKLRFRSY